MGTRTSTLVAFLIGACAVSARAAFFVMPADGNLFAKAAGGDGGAVSQFGTGTTQANFHPLIAGVPQVPSPAGEVHVGFFLAGTSVDFAMRTVFVGDTTYAFSADTLTPASRTAFMDLDNSLGMGGNVVQSLGGGLYRLNLDDAASAGLDDDDNDFLIDLRVGPVPEPAAAGLCAAASSGLLLARRRRQRA